MIAVAPLVLPLSEVRRGDVEVVGGKNASLGELLGELRAAGVRVPDGFATTSAAHRAWISQDGAELQVAALLDRYRSGGADLSSTGAAIREVLGALALPASLVEEVSTAYAAMSTDDTPAVVAVRSSATAEDLPDASFAGQQETYLGVVGLDDVLDACGRCLVSLYTDRAIAYREEQGFDHLSVSLSVGVQRLVRSDLGSAGVMFTVDPETGFPDVVVISSAWGLGETVVGGVVDPDEFSVFTPLLDSPGSVPILTRHVGAKQVRAVRAEDGTGVRDEEVPDELRAVLSLSDQDVVQLALWARDIAGHYGCPMDIEWARDGITGELFIVQARPETVQSRVEAGLSLSHRLEGTGPVLTRGVAVGDRVAQGRVRVLDDPSQADELLDGEVLVSTMTDPDWVPVMRRAAAIVTDRGGRTSHAAIVSRELGLPAVLGTGDGTSVLRTGDEVTVSCADGDEGLVLDGAVPFRVERIDLSDIPSTRTRVKLNLADPSAAFRHWRLGADGVGLARMEFVVGQHVGVHPLALAGADGLEGSTRAAVAEVVGDQDPSEFYVTRVADGLARLAAAAWPNRCIVRLSDFKSNEYAGLIGGSLFEPDEENPMLGWRGAARYLDPLWAPAFELECRAIRRVREQVGLRNLKVMVPFCRTPDEADEVLEALAAHGLVRGDEQLEVWVMAEVPSNVILAEEFAERFDGFSIGSNDLTQLILGIDRDNDRLAHRFDENHPAVTSAIRHLIRVAHEHGRPVGLCGQAPSNSPQFAAVLAEAGIDSVSVTPDSYPAVRRMLAHVEGDLRIPGARSA